MTKRTAVCAAGASFVLFGVVTFAVIVGATNPIDRRATEVMFGRLANRLAPDGGPPRFDHAITAPEKIGSVMAQLGSPGVSIILIFALAAYMWRRSRGLSAVVVAACVLGVVAEAAIKRAIHHPSPAILRGHVSAGNSYPSGHMIRLTLVAAGVCLAGRRRMVYSTMAVLVLAIGVDLLYLGAHWLSDLSGGVLLGIALVCTSSAVAMRISEGDARDAEVESRPMPTRGLR